MRQSARGGAGHFSESKETPLLVPRARRKNGSMTLYAALPGCDGCGAARRPSAWLLSKKSETITNNFADQFALPSSQR